MSNLPSLHAQATRLILVLREGLEKLEANEVQTGVLFPPKQEVAAVVPDSDV